MSTVIPSVLLRNDVRMPQLGCAYTRPPRSLFSFFSSVWSVLKIARVHQCDSYTSQHEHIAAEFLTYYQVNEAGARHVYDLQMGGKS